MINGSTSRFVRFMLGVNLLLALLAACGPADSTPVPSSPTATQAPAPQVEDPGKAPRLDGQIPGLNLEFLKEWGPNSQLDIVKELDLSDANVLYVGILSSEQGYSIGEYFTGLMTNPVATNDGFLQVYKTTLGEYMSGGRQKIETYLSTKNWHPFGANPKVGGGSAAGPEDILTPVLLEEMALPNARQREFPKDYSYIFVAVDMQANSYFGISRVLNATEALNYLNSKPYEGMEGGSSDVRLRIYQFSPTVGNPADLVLQQLGRENLSEAPSGPIHCPAMGGGKPNNCK